MTNPQTNNQNLLAIFSQLKQLLTAYTPPFIPHYNFDTKYDLWSHKEVEFAGKMRKEMYFAGLIIQSTYVGLYYMPIYAEPDIKKLFNPELLKLLKGKSCFHVKELSPELLQEIKSVLAKGFAMYKERGWVDA